MMDIKKLIEDLRGLLKQYGEKIPYGELVGAPWPYSRAGDLVWQDPEPYLIEQAANAITDLLARAEAAEARAEKAERALAHMWYAYQNKDDDFPHEYEKEALSQAENILGKWEDVMQNMMMKEE